MTAVGTVIAGRYRLVDQVAVGGMGTVWQAWDELLQRSVAVKQLLTQPGLSQQESDTARLRVIREARITARLHHPNAVTLYDVVEEDGHPCLIMQYVPSKSLSTLLRENGPVSIAFATRIGAELAAALATAHRVGVVHRDVKPGNVLITEDGSAKLTDFGISHAVGDVTLTSTGFVSGTPAFLAPEVARGEESGFPADVFSLGATLYAALEGFPPFGTDPNPMAVLHRVASGRMLPPQQSGPLTPLLLRMLSTDPDARPTMTDVGSILDARHTPDSGDRATADPSTFALTVREHRDPPPTRSTLSGAGPSSGGSSEGVARSPRRRVLVLVVTAVAALVALGTVVGLLANRSSGNGTAGEPDRTPASSSAGAAAPASAPPSTAQPTTRAAAPAPAPAGSTSSSSPTKSSPASIEDATATPSTTDAQLAAAVTDYYAVMPADTDEGWSRLTPAFQSGIAQNRSYYQSFWGSIDRVTATDVSGSPPATAEATITYYFKDGRVSTERTVFSLVKDGGNLLIDNSSVVSTS